jgi:hypothetical protein
MEVSGPLYFQRKNPWIGGRVGPRVGLDMAVKRKFPSPPGLEFVPVFSFIAIRFVPAIRSHEGQRDM